LEFLLFLLNNFVSSHVNLIFVLTLILKIETIYFFIVLDIHFY